MACLHSNRTLTKTVGMHIWDPEWEGSIVKVPLCVALEENLCGRSIPAKNFCQAVLAIYGKWH